MYSFGIDSSLWRAMESAVGAGLRRDDCISVGGGCINRCFLIPAQDNRRYFVKCNSCAPDGLFEAEAAGLRAMAGTKTVRVPTVVAFGATEGAQFLILEALHLGGSARESGTELGRQLAAMHRHEGPGFGFTLDNFIGQRPQYNLPWQQDWVRFFREQRLVPQFRWAAEGGLPIQGADRLMERIEDFFEDYEPRPSLLHGDLWGGNIDADEHGYPVLYDPACYYGDRESDLALTELFGGPGQAFYRAYRASYPLAAGYERRRDLYNLYHILNHYNHFGGGYGAQAVAMVGALAG